MSLVENQILGGSVMTPLDVYKINTAYDCFQDNLIQPNNGNYWVIG